MEELSWNGCYVENLRIKVIAMIQLPIILFGSLILLNKKKKRSVRKIDSNTEKPDLVTELNSTINLKDFSVDESSLDSFDVSDEELGNFEVNEEGILDKDDEEFDNPVMRIINTPTMTCDDFLQAIYVNVDDADGIPINKIAVEQSIIPIMMDVLSDYSEISEFIDEDLIAPIMIEAALNDIVPICTWKYDNENYEFLYGDNKIVTSQFGKDIIYGLMRISSNLIENFNSSRLNSSEALDHG